ncbi:glycosyltransferase [bacterium]|nr:glycosyltransferase [bacterium]
MKVLLSRPDKIGDVILALHGAKQLKEYCPDFQIYLHVAEYTRSLVENINFIDGVVGWEEDLSPYNFDAVVDLMAKFTTARRYARQGIPLRIGNAARWFRLLHTNTAYIRRSRALQNEAEYNWQLMTLLDPRLRNTRLRERLLFEDLREVQYLERERPFFCLFPGVSVSAESWTLETWCKLIKMLLKESEHDIVVMLGPAEEGLQQGIKERIGEEERVTIELVVDLRLAAGILRQCHQYVGPSTGITHLAGVVEASGVALYPEILSMHPDRWAPFHSQLRVLSPAGAVTPEEVVGNLLHPLERKTRKRASLSAFVICKNEELNIGRCLSSISFADEIILVDSGSTDRTLEIARQYPKVKVITRDWPGHREQKQYALEQCQHRWVLNLDADEELSSELKGQILRVLEDDFVGKKTAEGFFVCRVVYYLNRWWDKGGWHPEHRLRFFQRECAEWGGLNPHEKAQVSGQVKKLSGYLYHYTFGSITEFIETQNSFSLQSAKAMHRQGIRSTVGKMIVRPIFRFFKFYFLKSGYREGRHGFIQAVLESIYTFLKYAKLWELQRPSQINIEQQTRLPQDHDDGYTGGSL